jgi:hypothetical protein
MEGIVYWLALEELEGQKFLNKQMFLAKYPD